MGARRLTRSRVVRAVALSAALAPMGVAWMVASCILADPPPSLATIPPLAPNVGPVFPKAGILTYWPVGGLTFNVSVALYDPPPATVNWAMLEDDGTPNSSLLNKCKGCQVNDRGITIPAIGSLSDSNCHTFTLYVDTGPNQANQGDTAWSTQPAPASVTCTPDLCRTVEWMYDPAGAGHCPVFDAGAMQDAHDAASDAKLMFPEDHAGD